MQCLNLKEEKKLWKKGFKRVVGLDEVGRGPLAGPVVACAVFIKKDFKIIKGVNDSKKLSEKQREDLYKILVNHPQIKWGIGIVSEKTIDKINILQATKLAMQKSLKNLNPDFLLLDGNFKIEFKRAAFAEGFGEPKQKPVVKGDQKVFSIAAASIIAKVTRDRLMQKMHKKYPMYGFDKNKGYGTRVHFANIEKFGPSKIHRRTFWPVSKFN